MAHHEDRFCWRRPWSNFIWEVGSGGQLCRPRDLLIPTSIYREFFYQAEIFYWALKDSRNFVKKDQLI